MPKLRRWLLFAGLAMAAVALAPRASAQMSNADLQVALDTVWVMVAAFLVFFMNTGFALVESGFCRAKNTVNILAKNFIVFAIASIAFFVVGFALMFGDGNSFLGLSGLGLAGADNSPATGDAYQGVYSALNWTGVPLSAKFFFQLVFAGTAATIVSGAVAERIKFQAFILFSFLLVAFIYPIVGHWAWGGGFLSALGTPFVDFAGSTVVHSVGGWAALVGAFMLGPRQGKYRDGQVHPIPGHNIALATTGALILWLGWFGFNPGSTMAADAGAIARIALSTNMAAAAGLLASTATAWLLLGKPDLSMIINGTLAGLVAITAGCNAISPAWSLAVGALAGVLVVFSVIGFDKLRIDDPVGALSVHLVCCVFGTLAVGLFAGEGGLLLGGGFALLWSQFIGVVAAGAFTVAASVVGWSLVKAFLGMRVTDEEEFEGLDV
ncbi:ammonium transporter, partial [bacterium]|nr:ammonium transporter [bacterium]